MDTTNGNEMNETNDPDFARVLVVAVARAIRRWTVRADEKADLVQECRERIREFDEKRSKGRKGARQPGQTDEEMARLKEQLAAMQEALTKLSKGQSDDRLTEFVAAQAAMKESHESRMDAMRLSQERMESTLAELAQTVARLVMSNLAPQTPARPSASDRRRLRPSRPPRKAPRTISMGKDATESTSVAETSVLLDVQIAPPAAVSPANETTSEAVRSSATDARELVAPTEETAVAATVSVNQPEVAANPVIDPADPSDSTPVLEITADPVGPTDSASEPEFVRPPDAVVADRGNTGDLDDEPWGSTASLTREAEVHVLAPNVVVEEAWEEIHTAHAASARGDHREATKHWQRADELTERTSMESPAAEGRRSLGQVRLRRAISMARVGDPRAIKVSSSATLLALEVAKKSTTPEHLTELEATATEHQEIAKRFGRDVSKDDLLEGIRTFIEVERSALSQPDDLLALVEAT